MRNHLTRRRFLRQAALASTATALAGAPAFRVSAQSDSPNERLNIAAVGVGGRGGRDVGGVSTENIVALCDVDDRRAAKTFKQFPKADKCRDFRKMLDDVEKRIDAVVIGTPDHAPPAAMAMKMGKHVYCESRPINRREATRAAEDLWKVSFTHAGRPEIRRFLGMRGRSANSRGAPPRTRPSASRSMRLLSSD